MKNRQVFIISDSTGITAENLGHSLLAQFPDVPFDVHTLPYIDTEARAAEALDTINQTASDGEPPLVLSTIVNPEIRALLASADAFNLDLFEAFLPRLSQWLKTSASQIVGVSHSISGDPGYSDRIEAVNFALDNDDGSRLTEYENADIILVGVSRCGKTPTCLYLALHYGVRAANYPITEEDIDQGGLPRALLPHRDKLFGLTIDPDRLASIRHQRRANSHYASFEQCSFEVRYAENLFNRHGISYLHSTELSIEEISAKILKETRIERSMR
ncbi:kinase/pyrophosphorylase [Pseudomaricurvus alkylphenolicus]|jgi:regulator of PEP synthase PpsR (kinase-PPPase family)|uniref:posphoenolpyruvate synthetase regulatory kinase/phosphorylase PpsR n=1 Tax=Pseudomaricurvus alkylphenolicus TaxID=1306991 RepID=UPI00141EB02B|nr:pyruvate, water dikinase regulatory protein [Pseudomaricurvus alkylphenolicus]NIB41197.1 kinase/pyrophosphorylase [Pseudomaricurvus alkylphenolicus]